MISSTNMNPTWRARILLVIALVSANALVFVLAFYALETSRTLYEDQAQALTKNVVRSLDQSVSSSIRSIDLALQVIECIGPTRADERGKTPDRGPP